MEERIREIEFGILDGLTGKGTQARFLKSISGANGKANTGIVHLVVRAARMSRSEYRVSLER